MEILFLAAVGWLAYVYFGYPLALVLLGRVRRVRPLEGDGTLPSVSVLLAARNEERDIAWKLRQTLDWDYPADRLEILVASDASTDRTDEIIRSFIGPRVTFVRLEQRSGKNAALNELARRAGGDLLFFTDANSSIDPGAIRLMARHFADPRTGCVTGEMDEGEGSAIAEGARAYWSHESLVKRLESAIGSVVVCVGSIFCIRRSLYQPVQPELANDLELPLRIGHAGYWVRYEPGARSRERAAGSPREEFARRRRICAQGMLGMWRLRHTLRGLRGWQFVSRKFLRWLVVVPMALILLATLWLATVPVFLALLILQGLFYGLALVGWLRSRSGAGLAKAVSVPFYIVLVAVAGFLGILDAWRGRRFHVWEIANLSRGRSV